MRLRASCAELLFARAALGVFPTRACPGHGQRGDVLARPARPTRSALCHHARRPYENIGSFSRRRALRCMPVVFTCRYTCSALLLCLPALASSTVLE
jgi:hypothetical protein